MNLDPLRLALILKAFENPYAAHRARIVAEGNREAMAHMRFYAEEWRSNAAASEERRAAAFSYLTEACRLPAEPALRLAENLSRIALTDTAAALERNLTPEAVFSLVFIAVESSSVALAGAALTHPDCPTEAVSAVLSQGPLANIHGLALASPSCTKEIALAVLDGRMPSADPLRAAQCSALSFPEVLEAIESREATPVLCASGRPLSECLHFVYARPDAPALPAQGVERVFLRVVPTPADSEALAKVMDKLTSDTLTEIVLSPGCTREMCSLILREKGHLVSLDAVQDVARRHALESDCASAALARLPVGAYKFTQPVRACLLVDSADDPDAPRMRQGVAKEIHVNLFNSRSQVEVDFVSPTEDPLWGRPEPVTPSKASPAKFRFIDPAQVFAAALETTTQEIARRQAVAQSFGVKP